MGPDDRVAAVTGGAGYIGAAITSWLSDAGFQVAVLDREGDFAVDLADEGSVRAASRRILEKFGRCDVLVHAGVAFDRITLSEIDVTAWRKVMAVNVEAPIWLCQELTPTMAQRHWGRVVFIVSDTVWNPPPVPDMLPYITSKGALIGASRSLARSLGASGITVNCVAPGLTPPPGSNAMRPEWVDDVRRQQALPRSLVPADVAGVVTFLASDAAQAMTGQVLCPDGGLVLR